MLLRFVENFNAFIHSTHCCSISTLVSPNGPKVNHYKQSKWVIEEASLLKTVRRDYKCRVCPRVEQLHQVAKMFNVEKYTGLSVKIVLV